ncbi:MAG: endonuclease/exonuclease/phosphatase family protein [Flavobacteriaceae bacterium]
MRKLSFVGKIIFFANVVFALITVIAFVVPYVPVTSLPTLSTISLIVPFLVYVNVAFVFFWSLKKRIHVVLSMVLLILWYFVLGPFYLFSSGDGMDSSDTFTIMSFNARKFNMNREIPIDNVDSLIIAFVERERPDIVCFQECHYAMKRSKALQSYDYKFVDFVYGEHEGKKVIQAIYSKYPLLDVNSINFPESSNSAIYADIVLKKDTVRLYNIHLQSFRIIPEIGIIRKGQSAKLFAKSRRVMLKQYEQSKLIRKSMDETDHKKIVIGDFNNTQYSNVYQTIKGDLNDSFLEKGKGFGRTYNLLGFPLRIDYILSDPSFDIISHQNFKDKLSDHYPVMATFALSSD